MTRQRSFVGVAPLSRELSQYYTPSALARRMVAWAGVSPGQHALEPSAGGGAIVLALTNAGAHVTAVEIDPAWARVLRLDHCHGGVDIVEGDFLALDLASWVEGDPFDLAVANPPLNDGVAGLHVARMLQLAPRAVTLMRSQDLHGVSRHCQLWRRCDLARIAYLVRRPVFSGAGGASEFVVVDVRRLGTFAGPQTIEHW